MKSRDISRPSTFKGKQYSGVLKQQGRVLTDHDFNENEWIDEEERRKSRVDIIGNFASQDNGFGIEHPRLTNNLIDFNICPGTIHLGGIRFDLDENESYLCQKDWLQKPFADQNSLPGQLVNNGDERIDLVYVEAWEQSVSAIEDEELFEVALGGPDTTSRVRKMARVKVLENIGVRNCEDAFDLLKQSIANRGSINEDNELVVDTQLKVTCVNIPPIQQDLCSPSATGGYLGAENQAIRVQLVSPNRFTWGFDNAFHYYRVELRVDPNTGDRTIIKMLTEPKDQYQWPILGSIVEILPWSAVLPNNEKVAEQMGLLRRVTQSYNPDNQQFSIGTDIPATFGKEWESRKDQATLRNEFPKACPVGGGAAAPVYYYMRVWNRGSDITSNVRIPFTSGNPVNIGNTGLQITFTGQHFNAGDYWTIAARPQTPNVVVPWELAVNKSPDGVQRFFGGLALIKWFNNGNRIKGKILENCRPYFPPLNDIHAKDVKYDNTRCVSLQARTVQEAIDQLCRKSKCTITVIPGQNWHQVFNKIADGQDALVCFQAGDYILDHTIDLNNKGHLTFGGAGVGTNIVVKYSESAFTFRNCENIAIRDLAVQSLVAGRRKRKNELNGAISIFNCKDVLVENVRLKCTNTLGNLDRREATCLTIRNLNRNIYSTVNVRNSKFLVGNNQVGILAVNSQFTIIQGNQIISTDPDVGGERGIVVAGIDLSNTTIRDNHIVRFKQSILVAASKRESQQGSPLFVGPTTINNNRIESLLPNNYKRGRFGIFIGNCKSVIVKDNYLNLSSNWTAGSKPPFHGIYFHGYADKMINIMNNHTVNFGGSTGIRVIVLNVAINSNKFPSLPQRPIWNIENNVATVVAVPNVKFTKNNNYA